MSELNTIPLQQFIQLVKAADLSHQKEIKMDIKTAKALSYCLSELNSKLIMNYDNLINKLSQVQPSEQTVTIQMDGGDFSKG